MRGFGVSAPLLSQQGRRVGSEVTPTSHSQTLTPKPRPLCPRPGLRDGGHSNILDFWSKEASGGLGKRHLLAWKAIAPQQADCRGPALSLLAKASLDVPRAAVFTPGSRRCARPLEKHDKVTFPSDRTESQGGQLRSLSLLQHRAPGPASPGGRGTDGLVTAAEGPHTYRRSSGAGSPL